ncbi:MBOAT family O-acyltransferase [Tannockella kyphosi]|uniref:MBOAT family O-acyltransferase n=1 Tax=Tannockella kyphosi TaxID=2899121 RepID=UPI00201218F6|nr:MBOAT family O-acyltransferase [Tannockella kyphosi]
MINRILNFAQLMWNAELSYTSGLFGICLMFFIIVYAVLPNANLRKYLVLIASMIFYFWNGVGASIIVVGTALTVYLSSRKIEKVYKEFDQEKQGLTPKEQRVLFSQYKNKATIYLKLAIFTIVSIWGYVKITKLLSFEILEKISNMTFGFGILVPLGISYYTLSSIGYLLDVYWKKTEAEKDFINLFAAMIYFPHIVQGPISKYSKLIEQMKNLPSLSFDRTCHGLQLMLWGYGKKLIVANYIATYTTVVFANPLEYSSIEIVIAIISCVIQLYADFSGCMDIVRGISEIIGIQLDKNFEQPFFAKSASEFWARWHMTLGTWTKDYIYFPIAVNSKFMKYTMKLKKSGKLWRASFINAFVPLITVWLFTGIWHGTGIDYILWGLYWCAIMTVSKETKPIADKLFKNISISNNFCYHIFCMFRTIFLFGIGRMITITGTTTGFFILLKQIFNNSIVYNHDLYGTLLTEKHFIVIIVGVVCMIGVDILHEKGVEIRKSIGKQNIIVRWIIYYVAIMIVIIFGMYGAGYDASAFIYGAF